LKSSRKNLKTDQEGNRFRGGSKNLDKGRWTGVVDSNKIKYKHPTEKGGGGGGRYQEEEKKAGGSVFGTWGKGRGTPMATVWAKHSKKVNKSRGQFRISKICTEEGRGMDGKNEKKHKGV